MLLNNDNGYINFKEFIKRDYFVDKTMIIENLNKRINREKYVCITKPRRFGKSSIVDMLGAYYTKDMDSRELFKGLKIEEHSLFEEHLNKHNVIKIDFSYMPSKSCSFDEYMDYVENTLAKNIEEKFGMKFEKSKGLPDLLLRTKEKFIFIIDEWDFIFNQNIYMENHEEFFDFLRLLLKDRPYVALCYMTGILPIKKHTSKSALNMFDEYTFINDEKYDSFFGFTDEEVRELVKKNGKIDYEKVALWYNGYTTNNGFKVYNPKSVVSAMNNSNCRSYWTPTGGFDEVLHYLKYDIDGVRNDIVKLISGEEVEVDIDEEYRAGQGDPRNRTEVYSAMIILGFLSYDEGYIRVPNMELMKEYNKAVKNSAFNIYAQIAKDGVKLLKATKALDEEAIAKAIEKIHDTEIPMFKYNNEDSLGYVLNMAYLSARDSYRIEREEKTGKGYADFLFYPRYKRDLPMVIELKVDDTVDNALKQIKDRNYQLKFEREYPDKDIMLVAICYDRKKKTHTCKIEKIER